MTTQAIRGVTETPGYKHECDAPLCRRMARWAVAFDPGYRLHFCDQHKRETVANHQRAAS